MQPGYSGLFPSFPLYSDGFDYEIGWLPISFSKKQSPDSLQICPGNIMFVLKNKKLSSWLWRNRCSHLRVFLVVVIQLEEHE